MLPFLTAKPLVGEAGGLSRTHRVKGAWEIGDCTESDSFHTWGAVSLKGVELGSDVVRLML